LLTIDGPVAVADVPRLCARLRAILLASEAEFVVCDVRALPADALAIEALARLQLTARRQGRHIRLRRASRDLDRLVSFAGLADVLPGCAAPAARRHDRDEALP
jgi:ABC-type transporter Mla MlaB component